MLVFTHGASLLRACDDGLKTHGQFRPEQIAQVTPLVGQKSKGVVESSVFFLLSLLQDLLGTLPETLLGSILKNLRRTLLEVWVVTWLFRHTPN